MTVLGNTAMGTWGYFGYASTTYPNQVTEKLTAPSRIRIITLGGWIGGWNDTVLTRLAVFDNANHLLGYTDEFVVANEGDPANGHVSRYEADLQSPLIIEDGVDFYVGTIKNRSDAAQWSTGSTSNVHYESRAAYPDGDQGAVSGPTSVARRVGMYVANYQPASSAWVYRSGVWVAAEAVKVHRSGAWVDATSVQVHRSGAWVDTE